MPGDNAAPVAALQPLEKVRRKSAKDRSISFSADVFRRQSELEELPLNELTDLIEQFQQECKHLDIDNRVMEGFLRKNDPKVIEVMPNVLKVATGLQKRAREKLTHQSASGILKKKSSLDQFEEAKRAIEDTALDPAQLVSECSEKVNLVQKADLVLREMEEVQSELERLREWAYRNRMQLKAELEEMQEREKEIKLAVGDFEQHVLKDGVDQVTQKIPFEKFHKYFADWLKRTTKTMDKLRLRASSLKVICQKVNTLVAQKRLEGENLHAVDFENLQIQNKQLAEVITDKIGMVFEIKTIQGDMNLALSLVTKSLQQKFEILNKMEEDVKTKLERIENLDYEADKTALEVDKERQKLERIKQLTIEYKVPDVLDYVRLKANLDELKRDIQVWTKRNQSKELSLNVALMEMKMKTGRKTIDPRWLELLPEIRDIEGLDLFRFQHEQTRASLMARKKKGSKNASTLPVPNNW